MEKATNQGIDNAMEHNIGFTWHRLHCEREEICEVLLKEDHAYESSTGEEATRATNWHRALLQGRLRKIDDALDRLMSGSYGICCECGTPIEDQKLGLDCAMAYCVNCWQQLQAKL